MKTDSWSSGLKMWSKKTGRKVVKPCVPAEVNLKDIWSFSARVSGHVEKHLPAIRGSNPMCG